MSLWMFFNVNFYWDYLLFLGCLKLIFCSIAGSALFHKPFHAQSWLVTAVLFCWILTHAWSLNRRAATWLHIDPRLNKIFLKKCIFKRVVHEHVLHYNNQCSYLTHINPIFSVSYMSYRSQSFGLWSTNIVDCFLYGMQHWPERVEPRVVNYTWENPLTLPCKCNFQWEPSHLVCVDIPKYHAFAVFLILT